MGMVPETAVAMLACARIGAPHVVVFGGFSPSSLGERLEGTSAKLVITQDEAWRKGSAIPLKAIADDAVAMAPTVERMVVLRRTGADVPMTDGRDVWWHDAVDGRSADCEPEQVEAEHMLFALHTSGTTAKPKAVVHTTGGYLTYATVTHRWIFDIKDGDTYWCAADIGWVTGHSYIVYGPLNNGVTSVLYEGDPMHPAPDRHWQIIERYGVTQYYTAPTLIRAFIKAGAEHPDGARPQLAAAAGHGRRADQPRGVGLVLEAHRRRPLPDRRHVVADGDGRHHDHAAARTDDTQARIGNDAVPGNRRRSC